MRIAICISGNLRILNLQFINGLIDILSNQGFIVDSFISTWDDKGYWTKDDEKGLNLGEKLNDKDIEDIKKIKNLRVLDMEELNYDIQDKLKEEFEVLVRDVKEKRLRFGRPHNIVGMYYKIWRCNNLKLDYGKSNDIKYDYTFRVRPDFVVDDISLNLNEKLTIYKQPNELYLDTFFYGKSDYMDVISRMYLHLGEIYKDTRCLFDPHDLLKYYIERNNSIEKNEFIYINSSVFNTKNGYCKE